MIAGSKILLIASGGVSADADRKWIGKYLNRASRLSDGQKIYIPEIGGENVVGTINEGPVKKENISEGSGQNKLININTSSQKELESLGELALFTPKTSLNTDLTHPLKKYKPKR